MSDDQKGLYPKYRIFHGETDQLITDGFVINPMKSEADQMALMAYAAYTNNPELRKDIRKWSTEWPTFCEDCGSVCDYQVDWDHRDPIRCRDCQKIYER